MNYHPGAIIPAARPTHAHADDTLVCWSRMGSRHAAVPRSRSPRPVGPTQGVAAMKSRIRHLSINPCARFWGAVFCSVSSFWWPETS